MYTRDNHSVSRLSNLTVKDFFSLDLDTAPQKWSSTKPAIPMPLRFALAFEDHNRSQSQKPVHEMPSTSWLRPRRYLPSKGMRTSVPKEQKPLLSLHLEPKSKFKEAVVQAPWPSSSP